MVEMCISKLNLIMKGDVSGARELDDLLFSKDTKDSDSRLHLDGSISQYGWTSFQLCEALSVLDSFMMKKRTKCHCGVKNPPITKPTFGLIYMSCRKKCNVAQRYYGECVCVLDIDGGLNDDSIKANIIKGHKLNELMDEGDMSMSEVENAESPSNRRRKKYDDVQLEYIKWKKPRSLLPTEVRGILERLWEIEAQLCSFISDIRQHHNTSQKKSAFTMYFLKTILVPPTKFRKPSKGGELVMEHHRTVLLGKILDSNMSLAKAYEQYAETDVILSRWMNLQQSVNIHFNSKTAAGLGQTNMVSGICQTLEKKEGMFRQLMMGKRVNYACRSVISPDPYLAVNEIGIPLVFALKLTYPERVTPWNLTNLQDAILNGPEIHPVEKLPSSRGVTTLLGKTFSNDYEKKVVRRHLRNGDIVLVNRQPSLHKPSIIALTVRVLPEERTLRFHYANCDSFNADFDGDEINVHLPQDEISRAEAYNIVNANNQYIVPTRGDPKRGLIQDHIVGAVLLTKRDTFLTKEEFNQLICMSSVCSFGALSLNAKSGQKLSVLDSENVIQTYPPVIIKPKRLWTGKQVITAILNQITTGYLPFTAKKRTKIARKYFGMDESRKNEGSLKAIDEVSGKLKKIRNSKKTNVGNSAKSRQKDRWRFSKKHSESGMERRMSGSSSHSIDEDVVFVYKNELIQGVIDKEQFGKYGLVHAVQELYGSNAAGNLLTALGRVLRSEDKEQLRWVIDKEQFGKYGLVHAVQELYGSNAAGNLLTALGRVLRSEDKEQLR
uniref:DNA-directed RNA polymerase n=1 Tax=Chenopodium quinoa TaxID=63459 RepID=A0A803MNX9_CHEQI